MILNLTGLEYFYTALYTVLFVWISEIFYRKKSLGRHAVAYVVGVNATRAWKYTAHASSVQLHADVRRRQVYGLKCHYISSSCTVSIYTAKAET